MYGGGGNGGGGNGGNGAAGGAASLPLMPPCMQGSRLQLQLPGSSWSAPILLEATGTHGLVELESADHAHADLFGAQPRPGLQSPLR